MLEVEQLLKELKDVFTWTYKDLKRIPPEFAQHKIELGITIPMAHYARYRLNPNYVITFKQYMNKLLSTRFIQSIKATWLSPIIVVHKKNGKLKICIDFRKLNATIKKIHTHYLSQMKC